MAHEDLDRDQQVRGSSDRSFGVVFAVVFLLIALWPLLQSRPPRWWALGIAVAFALVAIFKPVLLGRLNRWWIARGVFLGKAVSPVALGVLFYGVLAPIGVMMRIAGKDPLRLKRDPAAATYWIQRVPPGPPPDSMTNQF